jgi:UDP-GlcNAc:undecaprenyl-phosphate/decaprenyl-phosphate GlcNAc-1-phosphate transferase
MRAPAAFALAAALTFVLVPAAIALARRTAFYDHPVGYKGHGAPTPYLGGLAVFGGFAPAALIFGDAAGRYWVPLVCAAALLALGTLDDRRLVAPRWRVLAEIGAAVALSSAGLGWEVFDSGALDLLLTVAWVVGLCNAFNLMDNLDGATGTVAGVSALGIGATALKYDGAELGAFAFALAGACAAFLRYNLARPARIFLGDGGSLPIGFLVAAGAMIAVQGPALRASAVLFGALLVGLAIFDTTLVVFSRQRAGVPLVTAGRDHLTHRLVSRLGSPRRVAVILGLMQAWLCGAAIVGAEAGSIAIAGIAAVAVICGVLALGVLETSPWLPERPPPAPHPDRLRPETTSSPVGQR